MKSFRKIVAFLLTAVMVLSFSFSAMAVDETTTANPGDLPHDGTISVTELTAGDVVSYYQVIKWVKADANNVGGWAPAAGFEGIADTDDDILGRILGDTQAGGQITQADANEIAAMAKNATAVGTKTMTGTTWSAGTESEPVDAGLYMVIITAKDSGVVYNPAFVASDFTVADTATNSNTIAIIAPYSDTAVAKKTIIETFKTASESDAEIKTAIDSNVGDSVPFNIETTIPVFLKSYQNASFDIIDKVTEGIKLDTESEITVYLNGTAVEAGGDEYTISAFDETGFTIKFKKDYLLSNLTAVPVKVTYYGKITNEAEFNVNQDKNEVTVVYSNGPTNEKGAMKDGTGHYTFTIGGTVFGNEEETGYELVKVGVDSEGNYVLETNQTYNDKAVYALEGAVFGLYTDKDCTTLYTNDLYPSGATYTTDGTGIITFTGLAAGTYYLKEISAPDGYSKDPNPHTIVITATYTEKTIKETATWSDATEEDGVGEMPVTYKVDTLDEVTITIDGETTTTYTFTNNGESSDIIPEDPDINMTEIDNTKGHDLPSTGGTGTKLIYLLGSILVLGAGILLVTRKRMQTK